MNSKIRLLHNYFRKDIDIYNTAINQFRIHLMWYEMGFMNFNAYKWLDEYLEYLDKVYEC
jgi:hypothetical protein